MSFSYSELTAIKTFPCSAPAAAPATTAAARRPSWSGGWGAARRRGPATRTRTPRTRRGWRVSAAPAGGPCRASPRSTASTGGGGTAASATGSAARCGAAASSSTNPRPGSTPAITGLINPLDIKFKSSHSTSEEETNFLKVISECDIST